MMVKNMVVGELRNDVYQLVQCLPGSMVLQAVVKYGTRAHRDDIMEALAGLIDHGYIVPLIMNIIRGNVLRLSMDMNGSYVVQLLISGGHHTYIDEIMQEIIGEFSVSNLYLVLWGVLGFKF